MANPETYAERIGRVRHMIAGTGDYGDLPDCDRAAIRTVLAERDAFLNACWQDGLASPMDWLESHLCTLRRQLSGGSFPADPEADRNCLEALEKFFTDLKALCARAEGTRRAFPIPSRFLVACKELLARLDGAMFMYHDREERVTEAAARLSALIARMEGPSSG